MTQQPLNNALPQQSAKPRTGLFDRIIQAIQREEEKQTRRLLLFFTSYLVVAVGAMPFSVLFFVNQWNSSGVSYFILTALENMNVFFTLWQDFIWSISEALPVLGIIALAANVALVLFVIRLFLHKKGLLLKYAKHRFA